jgi:hypothetical protein
MRAVPNSSLPSASGTSEGDQIASLHVFTKMERRCLYRRRIVMINYGFTKELNVPYGIFIELVEMR